MPSINCFGVGICVIVICVIIFIFAPETNNFYNNQIDDQILLDNIKTIQKEIHNSCLLKNNNVAPIYYMNKLYKEHTEIPQTFNLIKLYPEIKSFFLLKLPPGKIIPNDVENKKIANNTLRCLFSVYSSTLDPSVIGVWINGTTKSLTKGKTVVYDASKTHSIYNRSKKKMLLIGFDIPRTGKGESTSNENWLHKDIFQSKA